MYIHARAHRLGRLLSRRILSAALAIIIKHILEIATFSFSTTLFNTMMVGNKNMQDKDMCKTVRSTIRDMQDS